MKKLYTIIALFIFAIGVGVTLSACNEHEHVFGEFTQEVASTCTKKGMNAHYTCSVCGKYFDKDKKEIGDVYLELKPHDYDERVLEPSNCVKEGRLLKTCKDCSFEIEEVILKDAHFFDEEKHETLPTCIDDGNSFYAHCEKCNKYYDENGEEIDENSWVKSKTGIHNYDAGEVTKEPTCTQTGVRLKKCLTKGCTASFEETLAITPHIEVVWESVLPGCETEGYTEGIKCRDCNKIIKDRQVIEPTGHDWEDWVVVKPATDLEQGLQTATCRNCREIKSQDIGTTPHSWGPWKYNPETQEHERSCENNCGTTQSETCSYGGGVETLPTCTDDGFFTYTCSMCQNIKTEKGEDKLGHIYKNNEGWEPVTVTEGEGSNHTHTHHRICTRCFDEEVEECTNYLVEMEEEKVLPNCTMAGYSVSRCSKCNVRHEFDVQKALGHKYDEENEFSYDDERPDEHKHTCLTCFETEYLPCKYSEEVTLPTCFDDGFTTYTCETCNREKTDNIVKKFEHDMSGYTYVDDGDDDPSDDEKHYHYRYCKRETCDYREENEECVLDSSIKVPTCLEGGETTMVCPKCMMSFSKDKKEKLDHKWGDFEDDGNGYHTRTCENNPEHKDTQLHNYSVHLETTKATCENPQFDEYKCNDCESTNTFSTGLPLGHTWEPYEITKEGHKRKCITDPTHIEDETHHYSKSNLCEECQFDGLTYKDMGGHFVVESAKGLPETAKEIIIPEKVKGENGELPVTEIGRNIFINNKFITKVSIPYTVTKINGFAFEGCLALQEVIITGEEESRLTTIEAYAFEGCRNLVKFDLPNSLKVLKSAAFLNCVKYENITLPKDLEEFDAYAVKNTGYVLKDENYTGNVLYLNNYLISTKDDENITSYTILPETVIVGREAFVNWKSLRTLTLSNSTTVYEVDAFKDCEGLEKVIYNGTLSEWLKIEFRNDYASPLHYSAKLEITQLEDDIVIPSNITSIPAGTFRNKNIKSVEIENGVKSIGEDAFRDCANLKTISIPDSVTYIGEHAFTGTAYYLDPENWEENGKVFYIDNHLIEVKSTYGEDEGESSIFEVKDGTVTVGFNCFKDNKNITQVNLSRQIVWVGAFAFSGCDKLGKVTFKEEVEFWFNKYKSICRMHKRLEVGYSDIRLYDGEWKKYRA